MISIVLPVYNGEASVAHAISSVLAQEDAAFELIVVDDGSSDATPALLARYGKTIAVGRCLDSISSHCRRELGPGGLAVLKRHLRGHARCPACARSDAGLRNNEARWFEGRIGVTGYPAKWIPTFLAMTRQPRLNRARLATLAARWRRRSDAKPIISRRQSASGAFSRRARSFILSSVIGCVPRLGYESQTDATGEPPMTAASCSFATALSKARFAGGSLRPAQHRGHDQVEEQ